MFKSIRLKLVMLFSALLIIVSLALIYAAYVFAPESLSSMATIAVVALLLSTIAVFFLSSFITKPMVVAANHCYEMSEGDFTTLLDKKLEKRQDEIGLLARSFNEITVSMQRLVRDISNKAEQLASSSEELTASSEQAAMASEHVANSADDVAVNTEKQLNEVLNTTEAMGQISSSIDEAFTKSMQIEDLSKIMNEVAFVGKGKIQAVDIKMKDINQGSLEVIKGVNKLADSSNKIQQITELIQGISQQINLLALNAAIEAARAGDAGRGFAVVADEVKKLAEESNSAVLNIVKIIEETQVNVSEVNNVMEKTATSVDEGLEAVGVANKSFEDITAEIQNVTRELQNITGSIEQMAMGSQTVTAAASEVERSSKEVSGKIQNISAATEEQTASMEEITSSSQSLAKLAQELHSLIAVLKI